MLCVLSGQTPLVFCSLAILSAKETKLYYLQSRYYNPEWGRFLNADAFATTGQGLIGNNMFAYCLNNPVRYADRDGEAADSYAGMAGEAIGVFLYELFTGRTHPSRQTQELERQMLNQQIGAFVDGLHHAYSSCIEGYTRQLKIEAEFTKAGIESVKAFLESDLFIEIKNANGTKMGLSANKMRSGISSIKTGFTMILVPCPTIADDLTGVALITYGVIKASLGLVEFIVCANDEVNG